MRTDITTLRELRVHYSTPTDTTGAHVSITAQILQAADAAPALQALLGAEVVEVFGILCLSTKCRVIAYHEVSRGTLDATLVHPREVFKAALLANAASVMLAHNHPSGDPSPSPDDCALTRRLVAAGHLIGIPVTDHLIIGAGRWVSLRASGLLQLF